MNQNLLGYGLAITTGVCWAILAIVLKYALNFADSGTIVWVRMTVATALICSYLFMTQAHKAKQILKRPPLGSIFAGAFLAFNYYGYMKCVELTTASNTQVLIQLGPVLLLFLGVFYFKEEIRRWQWVGVAMALVGLFFFNWDQLIVSFKNQDQYITGNTWIVAAAITWALFAAFQKRLVLKGWTPAQTNLIIYMVCAIVLFPFATPSLLSELSSFQLLILFILGLNSFIAYGAFAEAMRLIPASKVSLIITCNPLLTILVMDLITFYGLDFVAAEPLQWRGYLGAALVVIGVALAVSLRSQRVQKLRIIDTKSN